MIDLKDKNIVITGASSGIGRSCAVSASRMGASLVLIGRNVERLEDTSDMLSGANHIYYSQDITEFEKLDELISGCVAKIGRLSGFIHCAGIEMTVPLRIMRKEIYEKLFSLNVISAFELARIISQKKYVSRDGASFVFVSSIMGWLGQKGRIGYCSSKAAIIGGAKAMALELASKRIRVNCVLPGVVQTEMTAKMFASLPETSISEIIKKHPLGLGQPLDVANACLFLLSDLSQWITGTNLVVDGGYHAE